MRDYAPPNTAAAAALAATLGRVPGGQDPSGSAALSRLNVSDPRFSATYGNPYLRQGPLTAAAGGRPQSGQALLGPLGGGNSSSFNSGSCSPPPPTQQAGLQQVSATPGQVITSSFHPGSAGTLQRNTSSPLVVATTVPSSQSASHYPLNQVVSFKIMVSTIQLGFFSKRSLLNGFYF